MTEREEEKKVQATAVLVEAGAAYRVAEVPTSHETAPALAKGLRLRLNLPAAEATRPVFNTISGRHGFLAEREEQQIQKDLAETIYSKT